MQLGSGSKGRGRRWQVSKAKAKSSFGAIASNRGCLGQGEACRRGRYGGRRRVGRKLGFAMLSFVPGRQRQSA